MMVIVDILALLIAAAGWHYLFYSRAASRLVRIEEAGTNVLRVRLRRINGVNMLLLGVLFFAGFQDWIVERPMIAIVVLLGVLLLLLAIVVLAFVDLRLTWKLRRGPHHHG